MTTKETQKETPKKPNTKKRILCELVEESKTRNYIIEGALSRAGLLDQYYTEKAERDIKDLKPSITEHEFENIIKEFVGE